MMSDVATIVELTEKFFQKIETNLKMEEGEQGLLRHSKNDYAKYI